MIRIVLYLICSNKGTCKFYGHTCVHGYLIIAEGTHNFTMYTYFVFATNIYWTDQILTYESFLLINMI